MRVYNFSAGPSMLPEEVLKKVQSEFLDFNGTGMSITEMSHRSKPFMAVISEAEATLRELMNIPDDYYVLFVQGGASTQFEAVPLNLLGGENRKADYLVTGNFSKKAFKEAQKYGDIACAASSEDQNFTYIPDLDKVTFRSDVRYVHMCYNNTIFGTRFSRLPKTDATLVADLSSCILGETVDVSKFGLLYAGAQKNIAPAGVTIVIVKKQLTENPQPICPTMLKYATQAKEGSLYNTPPAFSIYVAGEVMKWVKKLGGVYAIEAMNCEKAALLYDFIDNSKFYQNNVVKKDRSIMNVPFVSPSEELDAKFVAEAAKNGLVSLKGHRLVGGMRASIYNAMPLEGVKKLIEFMKTFEKENA